MKREAIGIDGYEIEAVFDEAKIDQGEPSLKILVYDCNDVFKSLELANEAIKMLIKDGKKVH